MMRSVAFVAWVAFNCLTAQAEYGGYGPYSSSQVSANIQRAESVLKPAGQALGNAARNGEVGGDAIRGQLDENLKKALKAVERNKEETELRNKVFGAGETLNKINSQMTLFDALLFNKAKQIEDESRNAEKLVSQLQQQTAPGVSSAAIDTSQLEPSCQSGVDFQGFKQMADQLGTEPFRYLRDNADKILEEKSKEAKERKLQTLAKLLDTVDKAQESEEEFQSDIQKLNSLQKPDVSAEAGIAFLSGIWDKQKNVTLPQARRDLKKKLRTVLLEGFQAGENKSKLRQLSNFFFDNLEQFRKIVVDQAVQGAQMLKRNCEKTAKSLGMGNPLAASSFANAAYQIVAGVNAGFANGTLLPLLTTITGNARCTDVTPQIEELFGANLQNAFNQLRGVEDPRTLIRGAMAAVQAVANAQAQVGQILSPLMEDCQYAAENVEMLKKYIGQVKGQMEQQQAEASERSPSQGQSQGRPIPGRANPTHSAVPGGRIGQ